MASRNLHDARWGWWVVYFRASRGPKAVGAPIFAVSERQALFLYYKTTGAGSLATMRDNLFARKHENYEQAQACFQTTVPIQPA